jgi:hypothetical protein
MLIFLHYLINTISAEQVIQHQQQEIIESVNWEEHVTATLTSYQY